MGTFLLSDLVYYLTPVCAIPTNLQQSGPGRDAGNGTLHFDYTWQSSTGNLQDLSACHIQERVQYPGSGLTYTFPSPPYPAISASNPTLNEVNPVAGGMTDDQLTPGQFVKPYAFSPISATQVYRFWCSCYQSGNWQSLINNPLNLYRQVTNQLIPGVWVFQVCKDNTSPQSGYSCAMINPLP